MYFPILRGKRFELAAVRELRKNLAAWDSVVPIIEPVKRGGLGAALNALIDHGVRFAFIANPKVGEFSAKPRTVETEFIEEYLDEYDNYYPSMYVDAGTTSRSIGDFSSSFDIAALYLLTAEPPNQTVAAIISAEPAMVGVRDGRVPQAVVNQLAAAGIDLIRITDPFRRQVRNSDYVDIEFFSDAHLHVPNTYQHVGDYSIVGDAYTEGGGAAYTVALHHVVVDRPNSDQLNIAHYKSDFSDTTADVAGKFLQALQRLVEGQEDCDPANSTIALSAYQELFEDEHFPGLGFAKKLGLMHHFEVMSNLLP
jgi:hypothetical protein